MSKVLLIEKGDLLYGLPLGYVEKVVAAQEIIFLKSGNPSFIGILSYRGEQIPVITPEFGLINSSQQLEIDDRFVLAQHQNRLFAIWANRAEEILELEADSIRNFADEYHNLPIVRLTVKERSLILILDPLSLFDQSLYSEILEYNQAE